MKKIRKKIRIIREGNRTIVVSSLALLILAARGDVAVVAAPFAASLVMGWSGAVGPGFVYLPRIPASDMWALVRVSAGSRRGLAHRIAGTEKMNQTRDSVFYRFTRSLLRCSPRRGLSHECRAWLNSSPIREKQATSHTDQRAGFICLGCTHNKPCEGHESDDVFPLPWPVGFLTRLALA